MTLLAAPKSEGKMEIRKRKPQKGKVSEILFLRAHPYKDIVQN